MVTVLQRVRTTALSMDHAALPSSIGKRGHERQYSVRTIAVVTKANVVSHKMLGLEDRAFWRFLHAGVDRFFSRGHP